MDEPVDNVIPFVKNIKTMQEDEELDPTDVESIHNYVVKNLDDVLEIVRNNPLMTGAMVMTFDELGNTNNYLMGSVSVSRLYTTMSLYRNHVLEMYHEEENIE